MRSLQLVWHLVALFALTCPSVAGDELSFVTTRRRVQPAERIPVPGPQVACPTLEQLGYAVRPLAESELNLAPSIDHQPPDCSTALFTAAIESARPWAASEFSWVASELYRQPAYFDDPIVERYGQARHPLVQPVLSGAHFFAQFPLMPSKLLVDRPHDHVSVLGEYRPGSLTPGACRGVK